MVCLNNNTLYTLIDNAIGADVGNYISNGTSIKAYALLPDIEYGFDYPPEQWDAEGIEIVIREVFPTYTTMLNRQACEESKWEVYLKNWETSQEQPSGDLLLQNLGKTLAIAFIREGILFTNSDIIQGNEELNIRPQIKFILCQPGSVE